MHRFRASADPAVLPSVWIRCRHRLAMTSKDAQPSLTKDLIVRFRVTPEEKRELEAAARRKELSLSAWLRSLALLEARKS